MPQFILDTGTEEAQAAYAALDAFTRGYIEAMFFTSDLLPHLGELEHITTADLAPSTLEQIKVDCAKFQEENKATLALAYSYAPVEYDEIRAGRDFWYTRNGHGTGFWDRGLGGGRLRAYMVGDKLTEACKAWRSIDLYLGNDAKLYLS